MRSRIPVLLLSTLLGAGAALAAPDTPRPAITVTFAPPVETKLREQFGSKEADVLRQDVIERVGESLLKASLANPGLGALTAEVQFTDLASTHPTREQSFEQPGLDPLRSKSVGGAALHGTVHDANGKEVASLTMKRFAPDLTTISASGDAWADARITIRMFASKLGAALAAKH